MSDASLGRALLTLARGAIAMRFGGAEPLVADDPRLEQPGATFVTLKMGGALRGCIGTLIATRPLRIDVMRNAVNAAFSDPRFPPLDARELADLEVEVSKLGDPVPIKVADEADLLRSLRPDVDGLVLSYQDHRATFLPQVWESLPDAREFVRELKAKAGLPAGFWHDDFELARYTVEKWTEHEHEQRGATPARAETATGETLR